MCVYFRQGFAHHHRVRHSIFYERVGRPAHGPPTAPTRRPARPPAPHASGREGHLICLELMGGE